MRRAALVVGTVIAVFFILRAVVELVTIDYADPSSYADDWGGPSLLGVLLLGRTVSFVANAGRPASRAFTYGDPVGGARSPRSP